jgi:hypothetical protein
MSKADDDILRERIRVLLADGLETEVEPFPGDQLAFQAILDDLREAGDSLENKLVIGGFLDRPYGPDGMRCLECMYYLIHRKWCDLPELALPVEPDWYCRLWRI